MGEYRTAIQQQAEFGVRGETVSNLQRREWEQRDHNRIRELEASLDAALDAVNVEVKRQELLDAEIERLRKAISDDLEDARSVCGGDGHGCEAYREYDWPDERKHRKCGQCPMDALSTLAALVGADPAP